MKQQGNKKLISVLYSFFALVSRSVSRRFRASSRREDGVSLIELLLAIGVFVISAMTVAHLFIGSQSSMYYSLDKMQAIFLAKQGIEEVRAERDENFNNITSGTEEEIISLDGKNFTRTVEISFYQDDVAEVTAIIDWESIGREEQLSFAETITEWEREEEEEE